MINELHIQTDGILWKIQPLWLEAINDLAKRSSRVRTLDGQAEIARVANSADLAQAVAAIRKWAADDIDWQRTLIRFIDENAARMIRPDRRVTQPLRSLSVENQIVGWTALPVPVAESILRHSGALRSFDRLESWHGDEATLPDFTSLDLPA